MLAEGDYVAGRIAELVRGLLRYIAVLSHERSVAVDGRGVQHNGLPITDSLKHSFIRHPVKDALAYVRMAMFPDDDVALFACAEYAAAPSARRRWKRCAPWPGSGGSNMVCTEANGCCGRQPCPRALAQHKVIQELTRKQTEFAAINS